MTEIYTDASVSSGKAVATCFIVSSEYFLGYNSFAYSGVNSSLHGELLGIRDGLKYALQSVKKNEPIVVYCDSNSALQLIKSKKANVKCNRQFNSLVTEINNLCKDHFINFLLIRGHQVEHNPNKVVDLISNTVLRYTLCKKR